MKRSYLIVSIILLGVLCALGLKIGSGYVTGQDAAQKKNSAPANSTAEALYRGDAKAQKALADKVIADINRGINASSFQTGNAQFNGEWAIGSYQMAVLGLGQVILAHPQLRDQYVPLMEQSVERLLTPENNRFGTEAWQENGLSSLDSANGHAYLGYTNLALSMLRLHKPDNRFSQINDQLTEALVRRLTKAPHGMIETYPNEAYPADLAAVIGSIGLYDRATGKNHQALLAKLMLQFRQNLIDPKTGLVFQAVDASSGTPVDQPRSSGTALSAYFLSFANPEAAKVIFRGIPAKQKISLLGLVGIREYPQGQSGQGDIDSGPLVMGASSSATAFSLGAARLAGDKKLYRDLYQTIKFLGNSPLGKMNGVSLVESPLGNAILLTMLTAGDTPN
jgi:hypothetical protein